MKAKKVSLQPESSQEWDSTRVARAVTLTEVRRITSKLKAPLSEILKEIRHGVSA